MVSKFMVANERWCAEHSVGRKRIANRALHAALRTARSEAAPEAECHASVASIGMGLAALSARPLRGAVCRKRVCVKPSPRAHR
jgi:hypothetical protein